METIDVFYRPVQGTGAGIFHKYLLYTTRSGAQFYASSYPQHYTLTEMLINGNLGRIETFVGAYGPDARDWDPALTTGGMGTPHVRERIAESSSLALQWGAIQHRMQVIDAADIAYTLDAANSNAAVDSALRAAGLPPPQLDERDAFWSPGSDYALPLPFWHDLRDWMVHRLVDALAGLGAAQATSPSAADISTDDRAVTLVGSASPEDHAVLL